MELRQRMRTNVPAPQQSLLTQLKNRLIISIALLVFCLLLNGGFGIYASISQQQLGDQKVAIHDNINMLLQSMVDQETGVRGYITTDNITFLDPYHSGLTDYATAVRNLQSATTGPDFHATVAALAQARARASTWSNNFANVQLANIGAGRFVVARSDQVNAQGKAYFDAFRAAVARLQQVSDNDLRTLQDRVSLIDTGAIGAAMLLTALVIIWLWFTFSLFTRVQRVQLERLKDASAAIGTGDLSVRVQEGDDREFNAVGHTFNIMAATLQTQQEALRDRDILEQVSQLNIILTASLDLTVLAETFLRRLLPLLDVQIAALYLYKPETQQLMIFASRGLQLSELQASFAPGEGLVGRVGQEREPLMVSRREQVDETFQIRTLVGAVLPASLYHLPLVHGSDLLGVLAVGTMHPMSEQTRNVLNVVASNLTSAIHNAQSYDHIQRQTQELIERSHQQEQSNLALRQQRDELTVLNAALEEANRVRSQFLSTMSHELRTPLASIIGFSQMITRSALKSPLTERQSNNVDRILKNAQHLLSLINDVLDLAKIEAGRMDVSSSEVDLAELIHSVIEETRSIAIDRHLELRIEIQDGITTLETDARKVRQILLNLISNALKFTEQGFVLVSAKRPVHPSDQEGGVEQVVLSVQDTGIGIPQEKQAHIFDAFYQVDNSNSRNYGGTGLGLSIVHELTTLLGGKVEFQSEPGRGSTFSVTLPVHVRDQRFIQDIRLNVSQRMAQAFQRPGPNTTTTLDSVATLKLRNGSEHSHLVVAIDDNPDVLQLITHSLEQTPYRVVGVQDSSQALALIQELRPSAITLDIMMPQVNGWQILHQLKSNPATASIPVILLTVLEDRSAGYVLGADEYLVKPVARETLINVLQQLIERTPPGLPAVTRSTTSSADALPAVSGEQGGPVVLIRHERDIPRLLERLVRESGYRIQTTDTERDVIAVIEEAHPDLLMFLVKVDEYTSGAHIQEGTVVQSDGSAVQSTEDQGDPSSA